MTAFLVGFFVGLVAFPFGLVGLSALASVLMDPETWTASGPRDPEIEADPREPGA